MGTCRFCGGPVVQERMDIGYTHCMKTSCVAAWRRERIDAAGLQLVKVHKQGSMWILKDEVKQNDMRRAGGR